MQIEDLQYPVWEKQPNEPDAAYTRFLFYLNLGVTRSLSAAYQAYCYSTDAAEDSKNEKAIEKATKSKKKQRPPGQWTEDSGRWFWDYRAKQFDNDKLATAGRLVIDNFYTALAIQSQQLVELFRSGQFQPKSFEDLMYAFGEIGKYITPEAVAAWRDFSSSNAASTPEQQQTDDQPDGE